jgi:phosphatidylserine synthase 2
MKKKVESILINPHTATMLFVMMIVIIYFSFVDKSIKNPTIMGVYLAAASFLTYSASMLSDGLLIRPHPMIWRILNGIAILYFLLLIFLLPQNSIDEVYNLLRLLFDKNIGQTNYVEQSYGGSCKVNYDNIINKVYDRFTLAHLLGWYLKALIIRDYKIMWIISIMFEIMEVTFQHVFKNFEECWWDRLILDIFGCNLLGMYLGTQTNYFLTRRDYNWSGLTGQTFIGKMKRVVLQFTPFSWQSYRWQATLSLRRFSIISVVILNILLGELNSFFIKSVFNIPIDSNLNLYRLGFFTICTYVSSYELYYFAEERTNKIGHMAWLTTSLVYLELLLVIKFAPMTQYNIRRPPDFVIRGWLYTFILASILTLLRFLRQSMLFYIGGATERRESEVEKVVNHKSINKFYYSIIKLNNFLNKLIITFVYITPIPLLSILFIDCKNTFEN